MKKHTVLIIVGVMLIGTGTAGITLFRMDQQEQHNLHKAEIARLEARARDSRAEEEAKLVEEKRQLNDLQKEMDAEKRRLSQQRRVVEEESKRITQARSQYAKMEKTRKKPAAQAEPEGKKGSNQKSVLGARTRPQENPKIITDRGYWEGRAAGLSSWVLPGEQNIRMISRQASRDAAELLTEVTYTNPKTRERVQAVPYGYERRGIRVRVRTWANDRLTSDNFIKFARNGWSLS
jgi:hypothetical protein